MKAPSRLQGAVALGIAGVAAVRLIRPWYRTWGTTIEEIARPMPLDNWIPVPSIVSTRAITIHSRPEQVWPWIVQMGEPPRAGFYSYTWIERLQGLEIENTPRILPDFQTLNVGDRLDEAGNMMVLAVKPGRYVALGPPADCDWLESTWVIALYPLGDDSTRLVARLRGRMNFRRMLSALPPTVWPFWLVIEPGVFVMERKMMLGIKRLAECSSRSDPATRDGRMRGESTRNNTANGVSIGGEIIIHRPVEEVFDLVADERNEPRYNPEMLRAEKTSDGPIGPGTPFHAEARSGRGIAAMTVEITAYERPRRLASTTHLASMDIQGELSFDPVPEGTRMRWSWHVQPRGLYRLFTPMIARVGRHQESRIWAGLKEYLEAHERADVSV